MNTFQRINAIAEARKAAKRAKYKTLPREVWLDDEPDLVTIPVPGDGGTRSTYAIKEASPSAFLSTHTVLKRPTEVLALLAAARLWSYSGVPPRLIFKPARREKLCLRCGCDKRLGEFARDKRFAGGRHAYCNACREEVRTAKWKRGA